jgi:hypothetical protein
MHGLAIGVSSGYVNMEIAVWWVLSDRGVLWRAGELMGLWSVDKRTR